MTSLSGVSVGAGISVGLLTASAKVGSRSGPHAGIGTTGGSGSDASGDVTSVTTNADGSTTTTVSNAAGAIISVSTTGGSNAQIHSSGTNAGSQTSLTASAGSRFSVVT